jgi:exodeoxyribonuclease-3
LRWLREDCRPTDALLLGGDFNIAPTDADVWDAAAVPAAPVSSPTGAFRALLDWGRRHLSRAQHRARAVTWWDYRAATSTRTSACGSTTSSRPRRLRHVVWAEIDREARKGPPIPSDHAPLVVDLDAPGRPFDPDWTGALSRIAARSRPARR